MKKISKAIILSLPLFFALGAVLAVEISTDLTNAVQHIGSWVKILSEWTSVATVMNRNSKVKIDLTDGGNFLIRSRGDNSNKIVWSTWSNILWWKSNEVSATIGSTIIAWQGNSNIASYSTIWWWENNSIENGSNNVILWWAWNTINRGSYSTIVWWASNTVSWANSVTVWVNNGVEWNNSAALWSSAKVFANNSFLWSDTWADLRTDDVFAVISQHGMVVNTDTAHSLAQLTVGWSIVISEWMKDSEIVCTSEKWKWTMKLVNKTSDGTQKCLCSCNWQSWDSLLWDGQCKSVCNGNAEVTPQCWDEVIVLTNEDWTKHYSWSCISWEVINWSYYMSTENVWWACQESNWKVELCNYTLWCTWTIPDHGHKNNNITPDRQIQYQFNITPWAICSFSCNTWYAWYKYPTQAETWCNEICNTSSSDWKGACNFWTLKLPDATWSQEYQYWCTYQWLDYQCDMSCPAGTLWAWNSGTLTWCQPTTVACWSTKDSCVLWETSNSRSDGLYFTWECLDSEWLTIANCSISKPTQKRFVYFDREEGSSSTTIGFRLTWAINTWVQIKLSTPLWDEIYYITWWYTQSRYESYYNDTSAFDALFMNDQKTIKLPVTDTVYELEMVSTGSINICSTDFQSAWSCRYWATWSNLSSWVVWDMATFTWKCTSWSNVKTCTVSRGIKSWKCTSIPTNGTWCDANKSGCTPLRWPNLNLRDFYITEKWAWSVTSNGSWSRVHCVYNAWKISCTDSTTMEDWLWWKCNPWYNTDIDACTCSTNSACNSNQYNASCTNWSTNLWEATFTEGYTYTCPATSETCNAKCADGKVWAWPSEWCINPVLCTDEDPWFNCYYWSTKNWPETVDSLKLKRWNCTIWDVYKECHKCFDGYVWNGSDKCVASSVACWSTGITAPNWIVFQVIALADWASTPVTWHDGIQYCTWRVSCNNGVDTLSNMNCTTICGDSVSNTPDCNLWSPVGWEWLTYNKVTFTKRYTFACSYEGYTYDACEASCNTNRYWSWTSCVSAPALCSSSHFGCNTIVWKVPSSTNHYTWSTNYTWNCKLWDILQNCNENVPTSRDCAAVTLNGTKTTGYYVRALSDNESIQVSTWYNLWTCTATATCSNTQVTLSNEICTPACDWEWWCNLDLTPRNYDGVTYKNEYHYNCGSFACTANCEPGQVWNGSTCFTISDPCINKYTDASSSDAYKCQKSFSGDASSIAEGYYWNCYNGDHEKMNGDRCYACKPWYEYSGSVKRCVEVPKDCTLSDSNHTVLRNWESIEMYDSQEEYCPDVCQKHVVTQCINGVISGDSNPWANHEESCDTINSCNFKLNECPRYWHCSECTSYTVNNNMCTNGTGKYRLDKCDSPYIKTWDKCLDPCEAWGGTWSVQWPYEPVDLWYGSDYYDSSWRIISEPIQGYYKTCWSTSNCSAYWYDCGTFIPKQLYWRSYTVYAEHEWYKHICSNNSKLNYVTRWWEDWNEVWVEEDDDYEDATHQHGACWSNASESCWDKSDWLWYKTDHNWVPWRNWSLLCENYWRDCSTREQHPINCDTCFFEIEDIWSVNETVNGYPIWDSYWVPYRCDIMLPSSYNSSNNIVDCWYRWRDIYCVANDRLWHYSWVRGTESPRAADWYAHTHRDTRYCWWAHWHRVFEAPSSDLCMRWTSTTPRDYGSTYEWTCTYGDIGNICWACKTWSEESCWSHY